VVRVAVDFLAKLGFGAQDAEGDPKPQMFNQGKATAQPARTLAWVYVDRATGEGYLQGYCE